MKTIHVRRACLVVCLAVFLVLLTPGIAAPISIDYRRIAAERAIAYVTDPASAGKLDDNGTQNAFLGKTPSLAKNAKFLAEFRRAIAVADQVINQDKSSVETAADAGLVASIIVDNLPGASAGGFAVAFPAAPAPAPAPVPVPAPAPPAAPKSDSEVLPGDQSTYAQLLLDAAKLEADLATFGKIVADNAGTPNDARYKAAVDRVKALTAEQVANSDKQALLKAALADANATKALTGLPAGAAKTAAKKTADQTKVDLDQAKKNLDLAQQEVEVARSAPTDKQADLLKLKAAEPGLIKTRDAKKTVADPFQTTADNAQKVVDDKTATADAIKNAKQTLADNKPKLDAANAELATAQKELSANILGQAVLRATVASTAATEINVLQPSPENQKKAEEKADLLQVLSGSVPPPGSKPTILDTSASFANTQMFFHTGVSLINPYRITMHPAVAATADTPAKPGNVTIEPATSTDTNAFMEFRYINRWAWNASRILGLFDGKPAETDTLFSFTRFDIDSRLGYTFTSGSQATANTLVGSGNFNAEISVAYPWVFFRSKGDDSQFSIGPAAGYSLVTDRSFLKAHNRIFGGVAYSTSFKDAFGSKDIDGHPRRALLDVRLGWSVIDTVRYSRDANGQVFPDGTINATPDLLPHYYRQDVDAFEATLMYPVKTSTYVTFDGRVYSRAKPGLWSMQIGITTSLADLIDAFMK